MGLLVQRRPVGVSDPYTPFETLSSQERVVSWTPRVQSPSYRRPKKRETGELWTGVQTSISTYFIYYPTSLISKYENRYSPFYPQGPLVFHSSSRATPPQSFLHRVFHHICKDLSRDVSNLGCILPFPKFSSLYPILRRFPGLYLRVYSLSSRFGPLTGV